MSSAVSGQRPAAAKNAAMPSAAENPAGAPVASPSEQPSSAPMENMGMISPPLKPKEHER